jgi:Glyoxalase-like domain
MAASLLAVVVDCGDPAALARFWATALSREVAERNTDEFLVRDLSGVSTALYFMKVPEPKVTKNRLHIDVLTDGPMEDEVQRLVDAGATSVEVRQDPDTLNNPDTWTVMTDPEGNEFCVTSSATLTGWT